MKGHLCRWGEQCPRLVPFFNTMRRRVRVWDNGGKTVDRYTVVIYRKDHGATFSDIYSMSEDPMSPQGMSQFSHSGAGRIQYGSDDPLFGKRLFTNSIPYEVMKGIEQRL